MKKIILLAPFLALLFSFNVNAATTGNTYNGTDQDGRTLNVRYQSFTNMPPTNTQEITNGNLTSYISTWEITENLDIILVPERYYTGWVTVGLTIVPAQTAVRTQVYIDSPSTTQGLYTYVTSESANRVNVTFVFDNFYPPPGEAVYGSSTLHITYVNQNSTAPVVSNAFQPTIQVTNGLHSYDGVVNNGLTNMIYSAIYQSVGPDLQTTIGLLTDIRNQDYTYYNQIINALGLQGQIHLDLSNIYAVLVGTQNNIQDGFEDVQTILDLFPSYRTQVLQYWQQLLEMNAAQSSTANAIQENYSNAESNADQMAGQLGSVDLPTISSGNLNILGSVDSTQKNNFFGMLSIITHTEVVTKIMLIIVIGAMVGFILYGKKGG